MNAEDIDEWLDDWIETHLVHAAGDADFVALTERCRADAAADGIGERALMAACGGDLAAWLAEEAGSILPPEF